MTPGLQCSMRDRSQRCLLDEGHDGPHDAVAHDREGLERLPKLDVKAPGYERPLGGSHVLEALTRASPATYLRGAVVATNRADGEVTGQVVETFGFDVDVLAEDHDADLEADAIAEGFIDETERDAGLDRLADELDVAIARAAQDAATPLEGLPMFAPSWSVRLTLPLPPSANDLLRPIVVGWKGAREPIMSFAKTTVAKDWVELAGRLVDAQFPKLTGVGEVHTLHRGPIEWWATFYVKMISKDCTNSVKQLEDVLTGRVWHDDCQVVQAHQKKRITAREERVIIEIRPGASDEETTKRIMKSKSAGGSGR